MFDNAMEAEEISDVCDNYLLCVSESKDSLRNKSQENVVIGIVVSNLEYFL